MRLLAIERGIHIKPVSGIQVTPFNVSICWTVGDVIDKHVLRYSDVMMCAVSLTAIHMKGTAASSMCQVDEKSSCHTHCIC